MRHNRWIPVVMSLFLAESLTPMFAAEKMQLAVLDLQPRGVSKVIAGGVTDMIRADLVDAGIFKVVERSQMNEIIKEQGFQMTGCTDQACAVQVGKLLSAKKILVGETTKMGKSIVITVRIVDVEKGLAEFAARDIAANDDALETASRSLSKKLIERISGKSAAEILSEREPRTKTGYYLRSIVPGWGQLYAGRTGKGIGFMSAFAVSAAFSGWAVMDYVKKKNAYDDLAYGEPKSEFDSRYDDYEKAGKITLVSMGILSAVYLAHWADAIFFSKPEFDRYTNAAMPEEKVFVSINPIIEYRERPERGMMVTIGMRF